MEFRAIALGKSSLATREGTSAWDAGPPNDCAEPVMNESGELLHESIEAEKKCGAGQRENEPVLGDVLHPGANTGSTRTEPKNAKIAVGECRQHPAHGASPGGSWRGVYGSRYS
jgi:hypothetical protein